MDQFPLFNEIDTMWASDPVVDAQPIRSEPVKSEPVNEHKIKAVHDLIREVEMDGVDDNVADPDYKLPAATPTTVTRRSGRKRPAARAGPAQDGGRVKQRRISDQVLKTSDGFKKPTKLYDHDESFSDPQLEKARLNAINAKQNRDRKKREKEALTSEMSTLRQRNEELEQEKEREAKRAEDAVAELNRIREVLRRAGLETIVERCEVDHLSQMDKEKCRICCQESGSISEVCSALLLPPSLDSSEASPLGLDASDMHDADSMRLTEQESAVDLLQGILNDL